MSWAMKAWHEYAIAVVNGTAEDYMEALSLIVEKYRREAEERKVSSVNFPRWLRAWSEVDTASPGDGQQIRGAAQ
jgi:hypothetical protein